LVHTRVAHRPRHQSLPAVHQSSVSKLALRRLIAPKSFQPLVNATRDADLD
jgi:hypothetical protein